MALFVIMSLSLGGSISALHDVVASYESWFGHVPQNSQTASILVPPSGPVSYPKGRNMAPRRLAIAGDSLVPTEQFLFPVSDTEVVPVQVEQPQSNTISTYTVQSGDTISQIAEKFGVTANTIRWANDIAVRDTIRVGQKLVILPIAGLSYTVQSGDTVSGIVAKFKADENEVRVFNGLDPQASIRVGQKLIIPGGELPAETSSRVASKSSSSKSQVTPPRSSASSSNYFIRPAAGIVTRGIGGRHKGLDIANDTGTAIKAAASGTVIVAKGSGWNGGFGSHIVVDHPNGSQTLYAHLSGLNVSVGQSVSQGQTIGRMGNTGRSTGPHLHFEIRGLKSLPGWMY